MQVQEIMTNNPACCTPEMDLQQAAKLMLQYDCGAIPVVEDAQSYRLIGIITEDDILRFAFGRPERFKEPVRNAMTSTFSVLTG